MTKDDLYLEEDHELIRTIWGYFVDDIHAQVMTPTNIMYTLGQLRGIQACTHYQEPQMLATRLAQVVRECVNDGHLHIKTNTRD